MDPALAAQDHLSTRTDGSAYEAVGLALCQFYAHPAAIHALSPTVGSCWCESILEMVLRTVAQIPVWSEYDAQFLFEFARMVAQKVQPENLPAIDRFLTQAKTAHARSVLDMWRSQALGKRIGLGTMARVEGGT